MFDLNQRITENVGSDISSKNTNSDQEPCNGYQFIRWSNNL